MLKGFYLSLLIGPVLPAPAPRAVIDAVQSVQVTTASGSRSGFQIQLSISKQGPIQQSLLPSGFFDPLTRVIIVVTVNGQQNILMDGLISRHDLSPSNEPNHSTLTLTGEDLSVAMSLVDLSQLIPYPAMPAEARVALAVARYAQYGLIPIIIPSPLFEIPNPLEEWPWHQGTDLDYINQLARETGYVFYVTPGPTIGTNFAYWGPEIRFGSVQPALSVNMDAHTNVESMSFGFDGLSARLPIMMIYEKNSHVTIPVPLPAVGLLRPPLAAKPAIPFPQFLWDEGSAKYSPIRAAAVGLAKAAQTSDNATASGSLDVLRYGRVLKARSLVDVRGAGHTYDGTYYVKSVTHQIRKGEYKQSFSLAREGVIPLNTRVVT